MKPDKKRPHLEPDKKRPHLSDDKFEVSKPELQVKIQSPNGIKASNQKTRPKTYAEEREEMLNTHKNYLDAAESSWISRPEVVPAIRIAKHKETRKPPSPQKENKK